MKETTGRRESTGQGDAGRNRGKEGQKRERKSQKTIRANRQKGLFDNRLAKNETGT